MPQQDVQLEKRFHQAMLGIYDAAKRLKPPYNATRFLRMVNEHGGKDTADTLLATPDVSEGFTELFLRGRRPRFERRIPGAAKPVAAALSPRATGCGPQTSPEARVRPTNRRRCIIERAVVSSRSPRLRAVRRANVGMAHMAKTNQKRQRIRQKHAARARDRQKRLHAKSVSRQKAVARGRPHDKSAVVHTYHAPFGVVVTQQDPDAMHLRPLGGVNVHRPRVEAEVRVRQKAESSLLAKHAAGTYTDPKQINEILHGQFRFFDSELKQTIPMLGSRAFMEFVLFQYDQSCKVDAQSKKGALSSADSEYWLGMGHRWRRALKYLAECTVLLAPEEATGRS